MILKPNLSRIAVAVALAVGLAAPAIANETTSNIRGIVTSTSGTVVSNAKIVITDTRNGTSKVLTTNDTGTFSGRGLAVGGPYKIEIVDTVNGNKTLNNIFLKLGDTLNLPVQLETAQQNQEIEKIAVTGTSVSSSNYGGTGPATNFNLDDLQSAPAINRDIKDVLRADPRIHIDTTNSGAVQCAGANPRFNSLTVDGVRMNDNFGLNSNGYPTTRMPFSYDAISQVAVELAPFDVKYGGFTACNVNAVTKSGKSETSGSFFFDYTNDSMKGDSLNGRKIYNAPFNEKRYGFNVGGELVKDKLYFFVAAEKLDGVDTFDRGPVGSGSAIEVKGLTQKSYDDIKRIAKDKYGYDVGNTPTSIANNDEKLLMKLDWYINDKHRAAFTYNFNDGFSNRMADQANTNFEFDKHLYEGGAAFNSYVTQLMSDWTDEFSTEVRLGYAELQNQADPIGGIDIGEVRINVNNGTERANVYLGPDDSRHNNVLKYNTLFSKVAGTYLLGDHVLTGGFERETYDIYNLFGQKSQGEFQFGSVADFEAGIPSQVFYNNASKTNNTNDLAAEFAYAVNTLYAQDQYFIADYDVTLTYGLRYDWYTSGDVPALNQNFVTRYGFGNNQNIDGKGLLQPRIGANWLVNEDLEIRGGVGLYTGGNPNVWLSNNYQNNGVIQYNYVGDNRTLRQSLFNMKHDGTGRPLYDIPQAAIDAVTKASANSDVNVLDPNFEVPNEWKYALGMTYTLPGDYVVQADVLHTRKQDAATLVDLNHVASGKFAPDGRPLYTQKHLNAANRNQPFKDLMLTNVKGDSGKSTALSVAVSKEYDFGLNWAFAYANNKAEDVNSMTSSVAYSNYTGIAVSDTENPGAARSNYDIPHRFTLTTGYKYEFVPGYETRINMFVSRHQGKPYSFVFGNTFNGSSVAKYANGMFTTYDQDQARHLMYVPTGADDPKVIFGPTFDKEAFFKYVQANGLAKYAGQIAPRNEFDSSWVTKVDLRIEQMLPGFTANHSASAFFVIENLGNLLNDEWGILNEASFPHMVSPVDVAEIRDGKYVFSNFNNATTEREVSQQSLWTMRVGVKYNF